MTLGTEYSVDGPLDLEPLAKVSPITKEDRPVPSREDQ